LPGKDNETLQRNVASRCLATERSAYLRHVAILWVQIKAKVKLSLCF